MRLVVPNLSLVVLVGPSGSGKSSFARVHFKATEIISSDFCRALVADDETDQTATEAAFAVLHFIAGKRLAGGRLAVVDATNVDQASRKPLVELARSYHAIPVAIVLDLPERVCLQRNRERADRDFGPHVVRNQCRALARSIGALKREGFSHVYRLRTAEEVTEVEIERQPLWNDKREDHGPFDVIGDVHGCCDELLALLSHLGYEIEGKPGEEPRFRVTPPEGRKAVFLGDLADRGPRIPDVFSLVMGMVEAGLALAVPGNHDVKLMRALRGKNVTVSHGLADSLDQLKAESEAFRSRVADFIDSLVSHYVLDGGKLVVAHAGMPAAMQGRGSGKVREFALFGDTTGETDEFGLPVRADWAASYRGAAAVVYGHTPSAEAEWVNRTINIDTGCVFGGRLSALRWPERELVSVPAARTYYESAKPLAEPRRPGGDRPADLLDIDDVLGKRIIHTRLHRTVTVHEGNARAALEVMSRFAADPRWLIYLPPTMSPAETSELEGTLEHPAEALGYFRRHGVKKVICEQKHMGSRAVVVACRDEQAAATRFGVSDGAAGVCLTRTGRRFFDGNALETALVAHVRGALTKASLWEELDTDWVCLDCELMPWSVKAQELLRTQYAPTGAAAGAAISRAIDLLAAAAARGLNVAAELDRTGRRADLVALYRQAFRGYCWPVSTVEDLRLAPFHLLASEGNVHVDRDHLWHMSIAERLAEHGAPIMIATPHRVADLDDEQSIAATTAWWEALTSDGGEGMVVKPLDFLATHRGNLLQPAVKCRGREYLRIIYGPEYSLPEHLSRLRSRGLSAKRSLAVRELALGIEALERFIRREPLYAVHECVFAVLALESEPVDPRL